MPLLRQLMAEIVSHMFGPEHAAAALEAPTHATSEFAPSSLRLLAIWDDTAVTSIVSNKDSDIAAGYWNDMYGNEGHGPSDFDAYEEDSWRGHLTILRGFILHLVRGVRDAKQLVEMNPRVFLYDIVEGNVNEESVHELVFRVREYTAEMGARSANNSLTPHMRTGEVYGGARGQ